MTGSFGIDHPLIAVHDINALRERLISLGFNMTNVGQHPWGTSTSLAMFEGCLLEIMGIYDDSLLDEVPAGDFCFGRHVHSYLQQREGVALTALHSTNSMADAATAQAKGFEVSGQLEFGRDVVLPDGSRGRTKTTLALLPDSDYPRLSFFLCQQHRPELIYVPEWLQHPNTVCGIVGISIVAQEHELATLQAKLCSLYGEAKLFEGGFSLNTANGVLSVQTRESIEADFGPLPRAIDDLQPAIVAMDLKYSDHQAFAHCLNQSGCGYSEKQGVYTLLNPELSGNTFLRFRPS